MNVGQTGREKRRSGKEGEKEGGERSRGRVGGKVARRRPLNLRASIQERCWDDFHQG